MQITTKLFSFLSGYPLLLAVAAALWLSSSTGAWAQTADVATVVQVIPQQVRYSGVLTSHAGETVEVVFKIYVGAEGGEALWTETQRVAVGRDGTYSVLLGAASEGGLPQGVFAAGQARWLGVTVDRAEGVRAPLSSVAYAMKAGDAETVGGLAAANLATKDDLAKLAATGVAAVEAPQVQSATTPTGSGTADYVPLWTASSTLGNSGIYQAASGFVGIGTTTPGGPLQLSTAASGGANATMMLTQTSTASGNYYADIGLYNSKGLIGNLSALGSGYPTGNLFVANDVVFLGGQQNAGTNLIFLTNTSGALKFGTGGFAVSNERMRIGAAGGVSVGNGYVGTDPGAGNLIVSGKVGVGTSAPAAVLEVNGTAKFDGLVTFAAGQTFPGGGGSGTITGITTSSPLTGSGTSGSVALSLNTSALETTLNGKYAQLGAADTFTTAATFSGGLTGDMTKGSGYSAVMGMGTNGSTGVTGISDTGSGVVGTANTAPIGSAGVLGTTGTTFSAVYTANTPYYSAGIWADKSDANNGAALIATANDNAAAIVLNNSGRLALDAENLTGSAAYFAADGASGFGIYAVAHDDNAGYFLNDSNSEPTLGLYNEGAGGLGTAVKGTGSTGLFDTLTATSATGTCGIGGGSMSCTGPVKSLVSTGGGSRTVETYAPQSAENWMEDYGTGTTEHGVGVVQIDPTFADTVTADVSYHVFLTPLGELTSPLYVTKTSATTFEVREANGGTSSIGFDYKIVAKRRGYEAQRLVDVTDRFNAVQAETKRRMPTVTAVASKGVVEPEMAQHPASLARATALRARARAAGSVAPQVPVVPVVPKNSGTPTKAVAKPVVQK